MQFAIIKTGGKQYRVAEGDTLKIEKLPGSETMEKGSTVSFDEVLMLDNGKESTLGAPVVKGAVVEGEFLGNGRAQKIIVAKFKSKTRFRRTAGHRQPYSQVKIKSIKQ